MRSWSVYILLCSDGSFYTGCTNNVEQRVNTHNFGKGAKYTRSRLPVELLASRNGMTKSEAHKLEARIKKLDRQAKAILLCEVFDPAYGEDDPAIQGWTPAPALG